METPSPRSPSTSPNLLEPSRPEIFNFRFAASGDFKEKFERLAEVLGIENPLRNMAEIIEKAVDISLEKKDPQKKLERRLQKRRQAKSCPDEIFLEQKSKSRYIPSEVLRGGESLRSRVHPGQD